MKDRRTILVDLDHVVYDWVPAMALWLYSNGASQGQSIDDLVKSYSKWEVWDDWGIPKGEFDRWWRLGIEAGEIYGKGGVIPGARDALWKLNDAEWDIHLATNRLTKFGLHDQIVINTANWLRDNNIPYRQLSLVSDKMNIFADAIVDDRTDNMDLDIHGGLIFLFPANHNTNRPVTTSHQCHAWEAITERLLNA